MNAKGAIFPRRSQILISIRREPHANDSALMAGQCTHTNKLIRLWWGMSSSVIVNVRGWIRGQIRGGLVKVRGYIESGLDYSDA